MLWWPEKIFLWIPCFLLLGFGQDTPFTEVSGFHMPGDFRAGRVEWGGVCSIAFSEEPRTQWLAALGVVVLERCSFTGGLWWGQLHLVVVTGVGFGFGWQGDNIYPLNVLDISFVPMVTHGNIWIFMHVFLKRVYVGICPYDKFHHCHVLAIGTYGMCALV